MMQTVCIIFQFVNADNGKFFVITYNPHIAAFFMGAFKKRGPIKGGA